LKITLSDPNNLIWILIILSLGTLFSSYYNRLIYKDIKVIILIRAVCISVLILLFFDPRINISKTNNIDLSWNIYIDRSSSMSNHSNHSVASLSSGIDEITNQLNKKNILFNTFGFGTDIDTNWSDGDRKFQDVSTNIGQIIHHMRSNDNGNSLAGSIVFTDGQINQGSEIITTDLNLIKPIHVVGIGNDNPLVDIAIQSIDAPPFIIKGENAEIEVRIISYGNIDQKLNITLYSNKKLLGSKVINIEGQGSSNKVRFMINPEQTGKINYIARVNALPDEVNILNNKQVIPIQVLKDQYKVAVITGAPSFNTLIIKNILSSNEKFEIDHFYYQNEKYSQSLKNFWDTKYDLILFDNQPINENAKEWKSFIRIFAKKLLSQKSSFAIFIGNDTNLEVLDSYLTLMDLNLKEPLIELGGNFNWNFTNNWDEFFPFKDSKFINKNKNDYPPLFVNLEIDSSANSSVLAEFMITEVSIPLITIAEKSPLRYMVWSSPDLNQLFYKTQMNENKYLTDQILKSLFSWLMRTGDGKDFYFRSAKNTYQQGEQIIISGKPVNKLENARDGYVHVYHKDKKINTKPLIFDKSTGLFEGKFWASKAGRLDYDIEIIYGDQVLIVSKGDVIVQESKIELNNVFLNKDPLLKLSEVTDGAYYDWDNRHLLLNDVNKKTKKKIISSELILHESWWLYFFILLILTIEWVLRKKYGMI